MFRADEIWNIIYAEFLQDVKRRSNQDPKFLTKVNGAFICLVATAIRHSLNA